MARPKGTQTALTVDVKRTIADIYKKHPDWSICDIQAKIPEFNKNLKGKNISRSTIGTFLKDAVKPEGAKIKKSGIDQPWNIGTCFKPEYNIPADMIPILIKEQQLRINTNIGPKKLTIREGIWFARMYPAVVQIAQRLFPNDEPMIWHGIVSIVCRNYAYEELISLLMGKEFDTTALDNSFFIKEDAKIWESLKYHAVRMLRQKREIISGMEQESEPKMLESFITNYYE